MKIPQTDIAIRRELARLVDQAGSQRAWAAQAGVSQQYLNDVLRGRRAPGEAVLRTMGLRRVVSYEAV